jgi:hypothetical protein
MTRKVLTPWRGEEPESSDESDREMQGADLTNESEESEGSDAGRKERRPVERLARYYAACYVETPGYENRLALRMLASWFDERTAEWMVDECIRAGITMSASVAGIPTVLRASIPRRAHGPRGRESLPASQTPPPTMVDICHECATKGCTTLVCSGGDRQHVQSPYCSGACWREHAKDGRAHGPAGTKAWTDDTTNAIWRRVRLKDMQVSPRSIGTLRVNIEIGDPLSSIFYQQRREQEGLLLAQYTQGLKRRRQTT